MSVSFWKPLPPYILRRDGNVYDRASGALLGRVFGALHDWHWTDSSGASDPLTWTGYASRSQAVEALTNAVRKRERATNPSESNGSAASAQAPITRG